MIANSR